MVYFKEREHLPQSGELRQRLEPDEELCEWDAAVIIERWESLDALKAHLVADHMTAYREKVKNLVDGTVLEIYETS